MRGTAGVFFALSLQIFLVLGLAACGSGTQVDGQQGQIKNQQGHDKSEQGMQTQSFLQVKTSSGQHKLDIELALTDEEHAKGLMFRRSMAADRGMLFIYYEERPISMWMRNTILSLDMLFITRSGRIVKIEKSTEPFSERVIPSGQPVYGVLELNAGTSDRLAIKVGDRLEHPLLTP